MRRHHFIGSFAEEASFHWLSESERGGTILLGKIGRRWVKIFIDVQNQWGVHCQNYGAGWLEFHFMVYALPEGLAVKIKLFYGILQNFDIEKLKSFNGFYCQESQGMEILPTFAAKYDYSRLFVILAVISHFRSS